MGKSGKSKRDKTDNSPEESGSKRRASYTKRVTKAFIKAISEPHIPRFPWPAHPDPSTVPPGASQPRRGSGLDPRVLRVLHAGSGAVVEVFDEGVGAELTAIIDVPDYRWIVSQLWLGASAAEFSTRHPTIADPLTWFTEGFSTFAAAVLEGEREERAESGVSIGMLALSAAKAIAALDDDCARYLSAKQHGPDLQTTSRTLRRLRDISAGHAVGLATGLSVDRPFNEATRVEDRVKSTIGRERVEKRGHEAQRASMKEFHAALDLEYDRKNWPSRSRESLLGPLKAIAARLFPDRDLETMDVSLQRWLARWETANGITRTPGPKPKA